MYRILATLLLLVLLPLPPFADERLIVGPDGLAWSVVQEEAEFLSVARDSIWTWHVAPGQNISPLVLQRGGQIFAVEERVDEIGRIFRAPVAAPGLEKILDGDEATAFNPDLADLSRQVEIYIDLGGTFGIEGVRFFPRLDGEHRDLYLQAFELGSNRSNPATFLRFYDLYLVPLSLLINAHPFQPNYQSIVVWPRPAEITEDKEMRHVRIKTLSDRPWEMAELQIYANGTVPDAEFISRPLTVPGGTPLWGRLRINGGPPDSLPIVVQTRIGPDPEPAHYFLRLIKSKTLRRITRMGWEIFGTLLPEERGDAELGPILPNPLWTAWETVTDGFVVSHDPQKYIQFRVRLAGPGVRLEQFVFEYTSWPLTQVLEAEIAPAIVDPGQETEFVLTVLARRLEDVPILASGFRSLQILTPAEVVEVDRVLVNDREVLFKVRQQPGRGFSIEFWDRIDPDASFVQIFFRGLVFADGTTFRVQALDRRSTVDDVETISQFAWPGDADPLSPENTLAVRLRSRRDPLVYELQATTRVFTPNNDGMNDFLLVSYNLLKLTRPAPVFFEVYDLSGRRVRRGYVGADVSGRFVRIWDGRDALGRVVPPGMYIYQVQVEADAEMVGRQGLVGVVY